MARVKTFISERIGITGFFILLQIFVFTNLVVFLHHYFFPNAVSALPIIMVGGLIVVQPSMIRIRFAVASVIRMFGIGCGISFLLTLFFPANMFFYFLALLVAILVITLLNMHPFPAAVLIPINLAYWMHPGEMGDPRFSLIIFAEIAIGALLAMLVNSFVHMSLKKTLLSHYHRFSELTLTKRATYTQKDMTPVNNQMLLLLKQIQMTQKEYIKEKRIKEDGQQNLNVLLDSAMKLFFATQALRSDPLPDYASQLFDRQFKDYSLALAKWEGTIHEK